MPRYRITNQKGLNYLTLTVVGWIDVFSRAAYRDIVIDSLDYCRREKGLMIGGYVIMSNHIHLIAQAKEDSEQGLSEILRDFKKFTAKKIIKTIEASAESRKDWMLYLFKNFAKRNTNNRTYQFWIRDNHPIALWSPEVIWQKLDYIHLNPVRAKIVAEHTEYLYSSAQNYRKGNTDCLLEIDLIDPLKSKTGFKFFPQNS